MKNPLVLLVALVATALPAAETAPPDAPSPAITGIRVRAVWWQSPSQALPLYAEGKDGKPHPVRVLPMCPLEAF